jgi:hypothetical protein
MAFFIADLSPNQDVKTLPGMCFLTSWFSRATKNAPLAAALA